LPWKSFIIAESFDQLQEKVDTGLREKVRSHRKPGLGFVFTGQGAHWHGMGRELLQYSIFKQSLDDANEYMQRLGCSWSLIGKILNYRPNMSALVVVIQAVLHPLTQYQDG
jgi:acyl transferase domain-containing protein